MLILTRKRDGVIQIGEDVFIRVMQTGRGSVKIGIEAPPHVRILRGELTPNQGAADHMTDAHHSVLVSH